MTQSINKQPLPVPGLTGMLMLLILALMTFSSVTKIRSKSFNLFQIIHRLSIVFVILLFLHPMTHVLKEQINIDRHHPEKCDNRSLPVAGHNCSDDWTGSTANDLIETQTQGTGKRLGSSAGLIKNDSLREQAKEVALRNIDDQVAGSIYSTQESSDNKADSEPTIGDLTRQSKENFQVRRSTIDSNRDNLGEKKDQISISGKLFNGKLPIVKHPLGNNENKRPVSTENSVKADPKLSSQSQESIDKQKLSGPEFVLVRELVRARRDLLPITNDERQTRPPQISIDGESKTRVRSEVQAELDRGETIQEHPRKLIDHQNRDSTSSQLEAILQGTAETAEPKPGVNGSSSSSKTISNQVTTATEGQEKIAITSGEQKSIELGPVSSECHGPPQSTAVVKRSDAVVDGDISGDVTSKQSQLASAVLCLDKRPLFVAQSSICWYVLGLGLPWYLIDLFLRKWRRSKSSIQLLAYRSSLDGNLIELILSNNHKRFEHWRPGQFIYLNCPQISRFEWHPFTISSMDNRNKQFTLHIKTAGDWTQRLRLKLLELAGQARPLMNVLVTIDCADEHAGRQQHNHCQGQINRLHLHDTFRGYDGEKSANGCVQNEGHFVTGTTDATLEVICSEFDARRASLNRKQISQLEREKLAPTYDEAMHQLNLPSSPSQGQLFIMGAGEAKSCLNNDYNVAMASLGDRVQLNGKHNLQPEANPKMGMIHLSDNHAEISCPLCVNHLNNQLLNQHRSYIRTDQLECAQLATVHQSHFRPQTDTPSNKELDLFIDGPFHSPFERLLEQQVSVCIANGVGWTAFSSIFHSLISNFRNQTSHEDDGWWSKWSNFATSNRMLVKRNNPSFKSGAQFSGQFGIVSGGFEHRGDNFGNNCNVGTMNNEPDTKTSQFPAIKHQPAARNQSTIEAQIHMMVIVPNIEQLNPFFGLASNYFKKRSEISLNSATNDPIKEVCVFLTRARKDDSDISDFCKRHQLNISSDGQCIDVNGAFRIYLGKPHFDIYLGKFKALYQDKPKISVYCCGSNLVKREVQDVCKSMNRRLAKLGQLQLYSYHEENF